MTPARTIGPDKSYIDYYHGVIASRRGLQNCFGIRVNQHQCCAVIKIGDAHPFTYGKCYPLPVKIDTLSNPMRNTLDDHLMNDPSSDLLEVLSRRKSFLEAVNSPSEVEPQRMAATVKGTGNCISMTSECSERHLLALKVSESVAAVSAIKELQESGQKSDASMSVLLDQALTAQRSAEHALSDHIEEHGCVTL